MLGQVEKELRLVAKAVYMEWHRGPPPFELQYVNWTSGHLFATESHPPDTSPGAWCARSVPGKTAGLGGNMKKHLSARCPVCALRVSDACAG